MPLDGKQLDELLSGFIDGELTDVERELVEEAARDDVRIAERIEALRQQSSWVRQVGQAQLSQVAADGSIREQRHSGDSLARRVIAEAVIAEAVIAEAQRRGRELGLPATHHVRLAADDAVQLPAAAAVVSERAARSSGRRLEAWLALGGLAAAAAVLVAITWPKLQQQHLLSTPSSQLAQRDDQPPRQLDLQRVDSPDRTLNSMPEVWRLELPPGDAGALASGDAALNGNEADEAAGSNLVGVSDGLAYALVVDVEVSAQAAKSGVLEKLLTAAGIPLAPPVAVNAEILKTLDDSRLVVREPTSAVHAVSIQVVRGGLQELDGALRRVWQDIDSFPNVGLNLSIDSRAALMREMLRSSGDRFAPTDRFAVPLAFSQDALAPSLSKPSAENMPAGRDSSLMAANAGVQYVSSSQRENGWESLGEISGTTSQSLATILLVIHYAN